MRKKLLLRKPIICKWFAFNRFLIHLISLLLGSAFLITLLSAYFSQVTLKEQQNQPHCPNQHTFVAHSWFFIFAIIPPFIVMMRWRWWWSSSLSIFVIVILILTILLNAIEMKDFQSRYKALKNKSIQNLPKWRTNKRKWENHKIKQGLITNEWDCALCFSLNNRLYGKPQKDITFTTIATPLPPFYISNPSESVRRLPINHEQKTQTHTHTNTVTRQKNQLNTNINTNQRI